MRLFLPVGITADKARPGQFKTIRGIGGFCKDIRDYFVAAAELWELGKDEIPADAPWWAHRILGNVDDPPDHIYLVKCKGGCWAVIGADEVEGSLEQIPHRVVLHFKVVKDEGGKTFIRISPTDTDEKSMCLIIEGIV